MDRRFFMFLGDIVNRKMEREKINEKMGIYNSAS